MSNSQLDSNRPRSVTRPTLMPSSGATCSVQPQFPMWTATHDNILARGRRVPHVLTSCDRRLAGNLLGAIILLVAFFVASQTLFLFLLVPLLLSLLSLACTVTVASVLGSLAVFIVLGVSCQHTAARWHVSHTSCRFRHCASNLRVNVFGCHMPDTFRTSHCLFPSAETTLYSRSSPCLVQLVSERLSLHLRSTLSQVIPQVCLP